MFELLFEKLKSTLRKNPLQLANDVIKKFATTVNGIEILLNENCFYFWVNIFRFEIIARTVCLCVFLFEYMLKIKFNLIHIRLVGAENMYESANGCVYAYLNNERFKMHCIGKYLNQMDRYFEYWLIYRSMYASIPVLRKNSWPLCIVIWVDHNIC